MRRNWSPPDVIVEVMKETNQTGLWDAELAWYSPIATRRICRGREADEPNWTVRYWTRLILSDCYSSDLPRSWSWQTKLDCEILASPDTLRVLLAGFAEVVKLTNHWTRQILSEGYSLDFPRSWSWRTKLDCEILDLPDTLRVYSLDLSRSWSWRTTLDCEITKINSGFLCEGVSFCFVLFCFLLFCSRYQYFDQDVVIFTFVKKKKEKKTKTKQNKIKKKKFTTTTANNNNDYNNKKRFVFK